MVSVGFLSFRCPQFLEERAQALGVFVGQIVCGGAEVAVAEQVGHGADVAADLVQEFGGRASQVVNPQVGVHSGSLLQPEPGLGERGGADGPVESVALEEGFPRPLLGRGGVEDSGEVVGEWHGMGLPGFLLRPLQAARGGVQVGRAAAEDIAASHARMHAEQNHHAHVRFRRGEQAGEFFAGGHGGSLAWRAHAGDFAVEARAHAESFQMPHQGDQASPAHVGCGRREGLFPPGEQGVELDGAQRPRWLVSYELAELSRCVPVVRRPGFFGVGRAEGCEAAGRRAFFPATLACILP